MPDYAQRPTSPSEEQIERWRSPDDPPPRDYVAGFLVLVAMALVIVGLPVFSAWYWGWFRHNP